MGKLPKVMAFRQHSQHSGLVLLTPRASRSAIESYFVCFFTPGFMEKHLKAQVGAIQCLWVGAELALGCADVGSES